MSVCVGFGGLLVEVTAVVVMTLPRTLASARTWLTPRGGRCADPATPDRPVRPGHPFRGAQLPPDEGRNSVRFDPLGIGRNSPRNTPVSSRAALPAEGTAWASGDRWRSTQGRLLAGQGSTDSSHPMINFVGRDFWPAVGRTTARTPVEGSESLGPQAANCSGKGCLWISPPAVHRFVYQFDLESVG